MKIYVGEVMKNAVNDPRQPIPKVKLAGMINLTRQQLDNILNAPEMEVDYIAKIGLAIGKDFSKDFKELKNHHIISLAMDPDGGYRVRSPQDIELQLIDLQSKYIRALEDINDLRKQVRALEKEKK